MCKTNHRSVWIGFCLYSVALLGIAVLISGCGRSHSQTRSFKAYSIKVKDGLVVFHVEKFDFIFEGIEPKPGI